MSVRVQNAAGKSIASSAPAAEIAVQALRFVECLSDLIRRLETVLEWTDGEGPQSGDPAQVKEAVEQLSRYLG